MATSFSVSTTRGVPFDPAAAQAYRAGLQRAEFEAQLREARERQQELREQRRQELRAHGRKLDEDARRARRQRRLEIEQCYSERFSEDES